MSHLHRFFMPADMLREGRIALVPEEAHHALRVVRVRVGDVVVLFDGEGREGRAEVCETTRRDVMVEVQAVRQVARAAVRLTVAQGWLHREKPVEFLIEHGTELGVSRFVFFRARHSERVPKISDKWRRIAIETCKQCGRLWLPSFEVAENWAEVLEQAEGRVLIATKDRPPVSWEMAVEGSVDLMVAVGPEGDFAEEELALAETRGAMAVSLGEATYRSEMAGVLTVVLAAHHAGMLGPC